MIFMVRQQKAFVCPDVPKEKEQKEKVFAEAVKGIKMPKKQPQKQTPRGGSRGRSKFW